MDLRLIMKRLLFAIITLLALTLHGANINPLVDKSTLQYANPSAAAYYAAQLTNSAFSNAVQLAVGNIGGAVGAVAATNIAAYQAMLATNGMLSATEVTNAAAYQAFLATNSFVPGLTAQGSTNAAMTVVSWSNSLYDASGAATAATNGYPWGVLYAQTNIQMLAVTNMNPPLFAFNTNNLASGTNYNATNLIGNAASALTNVGPISAAQLTGTLPGAVLPGSVITQNFAGTFTFQNGILSGSIIRPISSGGGGLGSAQFPFGSVFANNFTGNGAGLTNLDALLAFNPTSTVPLAQLPGSVVTNNGIVVLTNSQKLIMGTPTATNITLNGANGTIVASGTIQSGGLASYGSVGVQSGNLTHFNGFVASGAPPYDTVVSLTLKAGNVVVTNGGSFTGNGAGLTNLSAVGMTNTIKASFTTNFTVVASTNFYCLNGTNQLITLPYASNVVGRIFRFSSTNGYGSFTITNAGDGATIRDGASLILKAIGIQPVDLISDGANWWLSSKTKVILPNAQFSCTTNISIGNGVATPVTFNSTDFDYSQGIVLAAGTNANGYASKMWITNSGQYEFSPSIVVNFSGADTVTVWFRSNDGNIVNSATAIKGAAGGSIRCVTIPFRVNVTQPTAYEIWVIASGAGNTLSFQAAAGTPPNDYPLSPSVICPVKKISDTWP